jgi:hypothetical protein
MEAPMNNHYDYEEPSSLFVSDVKFENRTEEAALVFDIDAPTNNYNEETSQPNEFGGVWSRAFPSWPSQRPLPCFDPNKHEQHHWTSGKIQRHHGATKGLFYIKLVKTASSTTSGVYL